MLSSSLWNGTTMERVGFAVRSGMVHLSAERAIDRLEPCQLRRLRANDRGQIHFDGIGGRFAGPNFHRERRIQTGSIRFDFVGRRGKATDSECSQCVRLGLLGYRAAKDDAIAGQNSRFSICALREYITSYRSKCGGAALSETKAQEQQDRKTDPNQRRHGCSSSSQQMQCACQSLALHAIFVNALRKRGLE